MTTRPAIHHRTKGKIIIGLMSGTSADGVNAALVRVTGSGAGTRIRLIKSAIYPYPARFRAFLLRLADNRTSRVADITTGDMLVASFFAEAVKKILRSAGLSRDSVDLIGSHGQTIHHLPKKRTLFGKTIASTLQIGNPSAIAGMTGITTVGDFRIADMALGGEGAPLVPLFDYLLFRSADAHRILLNIGGIANLTFLPRNCRRQDVIAFDTGPGNMVIDALMRRCFNRPRDTGGEIARSGQIIPGLLSWMAAHRFLRRPPPKSTGRELFGEPFVREILRRGKHHTPADLITTASEFTALTIAGAVRSFLPIRRGTTELYASGGGIHNLYLTEALSRYLPELPFRTTDALGLPPDAKEAVCFAVLANETLSGRPGNLPQVTGARKALPLGVVARP